MARSRVVISSVLLVLLFGCAKDPKAVRVTDANKDQLLEDIKDLKGLTVDESRLLLAHLMRNSLASNLAGC